MKASNVTVALIMAIVPGVVLIISGLDSQGLINAAVASGLIQILNIVAKTVQEYNNQPVLSRSMDHQPVIEKSLLRRILTE